MKMQWTIIFACVVALGAGMLSTTESADAMPYDNLWGAPASGNTPANRPGSDNIYGTGGPFEFGIQCAHCHIDSAGNIDMQFTFNPPLTASGNDFSYAPGTTYNITADMMGATLMGATPADDVNAFAASFEDAAGQIMGNLQSDSGHNQSQGCPNYANINSQGDFNTTFLTGTCHAIISAHQAGGVGTQALTQWNFSWTAPNAGAGDITMWWGATDGDASGKSSLDDDTAQGSVFMIEG
jgi:hypothetical protein